MSLLGQVVEHLPLTDRAENELNDEDRAKIRERVAPRPSFFGVPRLVSGAASAQAKCC